MLGFKLILVSKKTISGYLRKRGQKPYDDAIKYV